MALNFVLYSHIGNTSIIRIFCDNKAAILLTDTQQYPRYDSVQKQVQQILIKLLQIEHKYPQLKVDLIKIKSHTEEKSMHYQRNAIVDAIANTAAQNVIYTEKENITYRTTMTQIHKHVIDRWNETWTKKELSWSNAFLKKHITNITRKFYNISKHMNTHQMAIMSRLLTNHIELNQFLCLYNMKDADDNSVDMPYCNNCDQNAVESVEHYLLRCPAYHQNRQRMMNELRQVWPGYIDQPNITLRNVLLPFLITDESIYDPYNKCPITVMNQARIWKQICRFVRRTHRLKDLYRVDMTKLV